MISRFWWLNFVLAVLILTFVMVTIMIWQQDVILTPPNPSEAVKKWPQPFVLNSDSPQVTHYDAVVTQNLYHAQRIEHTPEMPKIESEAVQKEPQAPAMALPAEPRPIETLKTNRLNLFGVMIWEDQKAALVNNLANEEGGQVLVKEGEKIGEYTVRTILPDSLIVGYQSEIYKIPLFDQEKDGKDKPKRKTVKQRVTHEKPETPTILSTKEMPDGDKKLENGDNDEYEWVILNTPFGEKRIRRKK